MAARQTASCLPSPADAFASLPLRARGLSVVLSPLQAIMRRFKPLPGAMAGFCVSDPVAASSLTPPLAAQDSDSMPEPLNEVPAKSGRKRGRGACAPANRRPFRTLDGTEAGEGIRRRVFGTFCSQKVHNPPRGKTAVNHRSKNGNIPGAKTHSVLDTFYLSKRVPMPEKQPALHAEAQRAGEYCRNVRTAI